MRVGAVIVTPGSRRYEASLRGEYGHGRYANVISVGPVRADAQRLRPDRGHGEAPFRRRSRCGEIAFIQCVGSRDSARGNGYCSSLCCMSATKEALVAIEHVPGLEIAIFCIDVRAFGKEFDRYVEPRPERARRALRPRHPVARRRDAGHEEPARPLLRRARARSAGGVRPGRAVGRAEARRQRRRAGRATGHRPERVRLLRDGPPGADGLVAARRLRGGRLPGAEGHTGVGGAGERRGRVRRWRLAARRPRHADAPPRVPARARRDRRGAARGRVHLPLRAQHRVGGGRRSGRARGGGAAATSSMPRPTSTRAPTPARSASGTSSSRTA